MESLEKIEYVLLALSVLSLILHYIAPKTKNTVDDAAAEAVDAVKETVSKRKTTALKK